MTDYDDQRDDTRWWEEESKERIKAPNDPYPPRLRDWQSAASKAAYRRSW